METRNVTQSFVVVVLLTYTQNVEAKPLRDRFTDQLVREAVKSNMAAQTEVTLLSVLRGHKTKH